MSKFLEQSFFTRKQGLKPGSPHHGLKRRGLRRAQAQKCHVLCTIGWNMRLPILAGNFGKRICARTPRAPSGAAAPAPRFPPIYYAYCYDNTRSIEWRTDERYAIHTFWITKSYTTGSL